MAAKGLKTPECSLKVRTEQDSKELKGNLIVGDDLQDEIMMSQVADNHESVLMTDPVEEEWKEDFVESQEGVANFDLTEVVDEYESLPPKKPKLAAEDQVDQVVRSTSDMRKESNSSISISAMEAASRFGRELARGVMEGGVEMMKLVMAANTEFTTKYEVRNANEVHKVEVRNLYIN